MPHVLGHRRPGGNDRAMPNLVADTFVVADLYALLGFQRDGKSEPFVQPKLLIMHNGFLAIPAGRAEAPKLNGFAEEVPSTPRITNQEVTKRSSKKNALSLYGKPSHKRAARMLGYALTLGTSEGWLAASAIFEARLSEAERASLAFAALCGLHPTQRQDTATAAIRSAGSPLPSFLGGMEDARFWASFATPQELKAYALASFEAMSPQDQAAFFRHIGTIEVAA